MNHTRTLHLLTGHVQPTAVAIIVITALAFWIAGCADPRTEPLQPSAAGHTETIVLWENAPSNGDVISATFNVKEPLAAIENPTQDTPARLTIVGYIRPDQDILWREAIIADSIPPLNDQMIGLLIILDPREKVLKKLYQLDSTCTANPDTCDSLHLDNAAMDSLITWFRAAGDTVGNPAFDRLLAIKTLCADPAFPDTCSHLYVAPDVVDALISWAQADTAVYHGQLNILIADTTALGSRRDSLGAVVDNRYVLTLWLDDDPVAALPEAVYLTIDHQVAGQEIYLAVTDSAGYKGRRFQLDLNNFLAANPNPDYLGHMREFNWTTCGSSHACLSPGDHTLRAQLTGTDTRITGTLVLVYEGTTL